MENTPAVWLPDSFFRVPYWRFARASWLLERGKRASGCFDDKWVTCAKRFLAAQRRCASSGENGKEARRDFALSLAFAIWREEPPYRRSIIESLLLTTETFDRIASRFELPVEVIEHYHEIFFDVRPYLNTARDWIMARVIGTNWYQGFAGLPLSATWKYLAFVGGSLMLDAMVAITTDAPFPAYICEWFARHPEIKEQRIRFLGILTAKAMTAESDEVCQGLLRAHDQLRQLDQETTGTLDESPNPSHVMDEFLRSMRGSRKQKRKMQPDPGKAGSQSAGSKRATKIKRSDLLASFLDLLR